MQPLIIGIISKLVYNTKTAELSNLMIILVYVSAISIHKTREKPKFFDDKGNDGRYIGGL